MNVYVGGEDIRFLDGLDTAVEDGDEVTILPAVAGGPEPPLVVVRETRQDIRVAGLVERAVSGEPLAAQLGQLGEQLRM